jgi:hypothetical protein
MRVIVSEGVYIDFYNLHADAGQVYYLRFVPYPKIDYRTDNGDEAARAAIIQQVADYIDTWSIGNSVIAFRDTNSRSRQSHCFRDTELSN